MIALLLPILARWGVAERFQRPLAIAALVVAAALLLGGSWEAWLHFHDKHVVAQHDTKRELGDAKKTIAAEHRADGNAAPRDQARADAGEQSRTEMKEAEDAHPDAAKAPAGPVSRAAAGRFSVQP